MSSCTMIDIVQSTAGGPGYIWDPEGAVDFRGKHRLLGSFLGGVANFKSQNVVGGLPLQVGSDEIHLAVSQGWARTLPPFLQGEQASLAPVPTEPSTDNTSTRPTTHHTSKRRWSPSQHAGQHANLPAWLEQYYHYYRDSYQEADAVGGSQNGRDLGQRSTEADEMRSRLKKSRWLRLYYQCYEAEGANEREAGKKGGDAAALMVAGCTGNVGVDGGVTTGNVGLQHGAATRIEGGEVEMVAEAQGERSHMGREAEAAQPGHHPACEAADAEMEDVHIKETGTVGGLMGGVEGAGMAHQGPAAAQQPEQHHAPQRSDAAALEAHCGVASTTGRGAMVAGVEVATKAGTAAAAMAGVAGIETAVGCEPWRAALQGGAQYVLPIRPERPHSGDANTGNAVGGASASGSGGGAEPSGQQSESSVGTRERTRRAVFADLHSKGYALSAGPKFGADMLAYPGDPCLFHAQFTVRFLERDQPINPLALKAAARGSHAARKHMLLAAAPDKDAEPGTGPLYISIAPEAGFGKAAQ